MVPMRRPEVDRVQQRTKLMDIHHHVDISFLIPEVQILFIHLASFIIPITFSSLLIWIYQVRNFLVHRKLE